MIFGLPGASFVAMTDDSPRLTRPDARVVTQAITHNQE